MPEAAILIYTGYGSIIALSLSALLLDRLPYSLNKLFWIFCLFFFGIAPAVQFACGKFPFYWMPHTRLYTSFIFANNLIIACMVLFAGVQYFFRRRLKTDCTVVVPMTHFRLFRAAALLLLAALIQVIISPDLWLRRSGEVSPVFGNPSLQLLLDKGSKGLMLGIGLAAVAAYRQQLLRGKQLMILLLIILVANFPTALPRYWLACLYLGLLLSYFTKTFSHHRRLFDSLLIGGLLLVFPLLSLLRTPVRFANPVEQAFCSQDFDAYASLRNTMHYTRDHGYTAGRQLTTTLLFFVPRNYWPEKSIGSGALVHPPRPGSDFRNYASSLPAEGYIDFGVPGALIFVGVFAFAAGWYDRHYWYRKRPGFLQLFYPAYLGLFFFTLRGDLLSSFAYTCGIVIAAFAAVQLATRRAYQDSGK